MATQPPDIPNLVAALRTTLPDASPEELERLATLLVAVAQNRLSPEEGQAALGEHSDLLGALAGREVRAGETVLSFGDAQLGDVQISDVAGGDLIKLSIVPYGRPQAYDVSGLRNPFLGLRPFTYADRRAFAGRERAVADALTRLVSPGSERALLFVTGASGSGKSSFVQAGLVPALETHYASRGLSMRHAVMRPSRRPLAALAEALRKVGLPPQGPFAALASFTPDIAYDPQPHVAVLVIDQFEELFTQSEPGERDALLRILEDLPPFHTLRAHIICAIRSDFLYRLAESRVLHEAAFREVIELRTMSQDELREAIRRPIQQAHPDKGIEPALLERLAQDAAGDPSYLPLLQVTLEDLWRRGSLTLGAYTYLGDAIRDHAEQVYTFQDYDGARQQPRGPAERAALISLLLDLVEVSLDDYALRDIRRSRALVELTRGDPTRTRLVDELVSARLLSTTVESIAGPEAQVVDIVHESLIANWNRLREAIAAQREVLRRRARFELDLREWQARGRSDDFLLDRGPLAEAELLAEQGDIALSSPAAKEFLQRSLARREEERQRSGGLWGRLRDFAGGLGRPARGANAPDPAAQEETPLPAGPATHQEARLTPPAAGSLESAASSLAAAPPPREAPATAPPEEAPAAPDPSSSAEAETFDARFKNLLDQPALETPAPEEAAAAAPPAPPDSGQPTTLSAAAPDPDPEPSPTGRAAGPLPAAHAAEPPPAERLPEAAAAAPPAPPDSGKPTTLSAAAPDPEPSPTGRAAGPLPAAHAADPPPAERLPEAPAAVSEAEAQALPPPAERLSEAPAAVSEAEAQALPPPAERLPEAPPAEPTSAAPPPPRRRRPARASTPAPEPEATPVAPGAEARPAEPLPDSPTPEAPATAPPEEATAAPPPPRRRRPARASTPAPEPETAPVVNVVVRALEERYQPPERTLSVEVGAKLVVVRYGKRTYKGKRRIYDVALRQLELTPRRYGETLFESIFHTAQLSGKPATTLAGYDFARADAGGPLSIQIACDDASPDLQAYRWELLCDPRRPEDPPLAAVERSPLFRRIESDEALPPRLAADARPLRILVAICAPPGLGRPDNPHRNTTLAALSPIDAAAQAKIARETLDRLRDAGVADYTILGGPDGPPATLADLREALETGYHVLHLLAHGVTVDGAYYVVMERQRPQDGASHLPFVSGDDLSSVIASQDVRLAVLAPCQSGAATGAGDAPQGSLASTLVRRGVPAVIAMQDLVAISAVQFFTHHFYDDLARSGRVDTALAATRAALHQWVGDAQPDWGIPILLMSGDDGRLFLVDEARAQERLRRETPGLTVPEPAPAAPDPLPAIVLPPAGAAMAALSEAPAFAAVAPPAGRVTMAREQNRDQLNALRRPMRIDADSLREFVEGPDGSGLCLPRTLYRQVAAALNVGKHIILIGPPGTGKTTLAHDICRYAADGNRHFTPEAVMTTASADWTTFDTVGGYMPSPHGLQFRPGIFLRAICDGRWLVIDEINRAEIDKAFGELFTVLSGQTVDLPYWVGEHQVRVIPALREHDETRPWVPKTADGRYDYVVHPNWRIIGAMNVYDKSSLFAMSFAFMRRFAFIDVDVPRPEVYAESLLSTWLKRSPLPETSREALSTLVRDLLSTRLLMRRRALGPAIIKEMVLHICESFDPANPAELPDLAAEALMLYAVPQLDALDQESICAIYAELQLLLAAAPMAEMMLTRIRLLYPHIADDAWPAPPPR